MTAPSAQPASPADASSPPAPPPDGAAASAGHPDADGTRLAILTLTALGVVYGDIGTSPLYAFHETFRPEHGLTATAPHVYGVLSLILWALLFTVTLKYVVFVLRADNNGQGGVFALLALLLQGTTEKQRRSRRRRAMIALGLVGASLLYGEGIITPAISVLGAVEGLRTVSPGLSAFVVPLTVVILVTLFAVQKSGTDKVGRIFGPVMLTWFATLAVLGTWRIAQAPGVLRAIAPTWGVALLAEDPRMGFVLLGSVVLAVTGVEALYADMGHFGRRPVRLAWAALVLPSLMLNYLGQGAMALQDPSVLGQNVFYALAPRWFLYPLIALATMAAIVASQALISGAFSMTQQAIQLGYSPRMNIRHTSKSEAGQIFIPEVNAALGIGSILMVLAFGSVARLSAVYGIAVTGTMAITSLLFHRVMVDRWRWPRVRASAITLAFLAVDLTFFAANVIKLADGGWVPVVLAVTLFLLMSTWKWGREELTRTTRRQALALDGFLDEIERKGPHRVPGTAVFMTQDLSGVPVVLLHHLKHNKVLHERVILLAVQVEGVPEVPAAERVRAEPLRAGFARVAARYGFMQTPDVKDVLRHCEAARLCGRPAETSYYLGRERILAKDFDLSRLEHRWKVWWHVAHVKLFAVMSRNARSAAEYFGIPPNRVVELGAQVEL